MFARLLDYNFDHAHLELPGLRHLDSSLPMSCDFLPIRAYQTDKLLINIIIINRESTRRSMFLL